MPDGAPALRVPRRARGALVGHTWRVDTIVKARADAPEGFFEAEAAGLAWLASAGGVRTAAVDLSGQLVGDIGPTLSKMDKELGSSSIVNVSCAKLIRVDFIAAGDLLNWVLARRSENRSVSFSDAHRLVALFFGAMGINEHAKVKVRIV